MANKSQDLLASPIKDTQLNEPRTHSLPGHWFLSMLPEVQARPESAELLVKAVNLPKTFF